MSNLSRQKFNQERWEEIQDRRFARRRESGYSGAGYWFWNYPNMIGTLSAGTMIQSQPQAVDQEGAVPGASGAGTDVGTGVSMTSFGGGME